MTKSLNDFMDQNALFDLFNTALSEDGAKNDITSDLTIPGQLQGVGKIMAKQQLTLCGITAAESFFDWFDPSLTFTQLKTDGQSLNPGDIAAKVTGPVKSLLAVERIALNLLQHLCGIATLASVYAKKIQGSGARVLDTRKTIPGLRGLEKYAVYCGGGTNHRFGLNDAVLIKDNHITACGSVSDAILKAKTGTKGEMFIEVEISDPLDLETAIDAGADRALLDNMTLDQLALCVKRGKGKIELEASGNVNLETISDIANTGVDFISVGRLTHSAPAADLNMKISLEKPTE